MRYCLNAFEYFGGIVIEVYEKACTDEVYFSTVNDELLYVLKLNSWNVE